MKRAIGIFAFSLLVYAYITQSGLWPDPDSFYHTRMAMLMVTTPVVHNFPWLSQTVFADSYVDHHWLYHLVLVPFVAAFKPILGVRVFTLLVAALVSTALYLLITRWAGRGAGLVAAAIILFNNPLGFRINLVKAPGVANLFLIGLVVLLSQKKYRWAAVLGMVYVWAYNGWLVFLIVAGAWSAALLMDACLTRSWRTVPVMRLMRQVMGPLAAVLAGVVVGLVVNPYFPQNISFSWLHIVQIGIIGFKEQIGVGGEWYGIAPFAIVAESALVTAWLLAGLVALVVATGVRRGVAWTSAEWSSERVRALALGMLTLLFLLLTIRSRRHVENLIPFAMLTGAACMGFATAAIGREEWRKFRAAWRSFSRWVRFPAVVWVVLLTSLVVFRDMRSLKHDFDVGISPQTYAGAAAWFEANAPEGAVVWHSDWDDFPYFFLHTTRVNFILGLDPAFMYARNPQLYWQWVRETRGESGTATAQELRRDFGARYAFVDVSHGAVASFLRKDPSVKAVYEDKEGTIFQLVE